MSLRAFHVLFISAAILLALGVAWWCLPAHTGWAAVSAAVACALVAYETWFLRKTRKLT
jgi:phosphotransferase system  glucose/maltose/N-acetylglucosamine-specific IIC component